jgi:hypothetical protein
MVDTIRRVPYFYTTALDAPGEGLHLLSALKEAGVNLLAFSAFPAPGNRTQMDFVPADPEKFLDVARSACIALSKKKHGFLIDGADRPGAVAEVVMRLSDAGISITALDAVWAGGGRYGAILWVKPAVYEAAAKALGV